MKLNDNIYDVDLFIDFGISSTFNIDYLVDYKSLDVIPFVNEPSPEPIFENPFLSTLSDVLPDTTCQDDKFLDDKIITTQDSGIWKYLICWKEKVSIDDTWLDQSELPKIDHKILKQYESTSTSNSMELSSLQHKENDADIKSRVWHVYHRWRRRLISIS